MIEIYYDFGTHADRITAQLQQNFQRILEFCLEEEGLRASYTVSISFVEDEEMKEINTQHRGIAASTDVLSFPLYERSELEQLDKMDTEEEKSLGDIVLSYAKAKEQAEEYGHSIERELCFLLSHSAFHLLGYDHDTKERAEQMREKEEKPLAKLGLVRE